MFESVQELPSTKKSIHLSQRIFFVYFFGSLGQKRHLRMTNNLRARAIKNINGSCMEIFQKMQLKSNFKFELVAGWMFGLFHIHHSGWSVALTIKVSNKVQDITYNHLNPIYYIIYYCGAVIGPVIGMKYYGKPPTCYTKKQPLQCFLLFLINFLFLTGCYGSCWLVLLVPERPDHITNNFVSFIVQFL